MWYIHTFSNAEAPTYGRLQKGNCYYAVAPQNQQQKMRTYNFTRTVMYNGKFVFTECNYDGVIMYM